MAKGYSAELVGVIDGTKVPDLKADGRVYGARLRAYQATFDMASSTVKKVVADTNVIAQIPANEKVVAILMLASVTMGASATIAVGTASTPAKYRAAATFTTANVPTPTMLSSAGDDAPLSAEEEIIFTVGTADLPGAGILQFWVITTGR
ncbi:MAG: hypothetical protein KAY22_06620 [Rhizorhabdus sp.]|uniref:hypothetical protein n=1 Tax=Rhizorhabdus sp. TaxID=1968843 RepID=UPI001B73A8CB|nr:hypothetical protein [Rhizorhabdus sp.]MBP8231962.1 hypothetical protein [Rhizorhabdus sp.]